MEESSPPKIQVFMRTIALLYHDVVPDGRFELSGFQSPDADIYKLDSMEFRSHLHSIGRVAGQPASILDLASSRGPVLVLTFDDGGASAVEIADMLEEFGWIGHFFVTTGRIGTPGFLGESQIAGLRRRGHVIGSHSCSHPARMSYCSRDELDREWRDSINRLQEILGEQVVIASVPGGYYSHGVASSAARAGIRVLFNSEPVSKTQLVDGCTVVGRFSVQQGVPESWVCAVAAGRALPRWQRYLFWNGKKLLKIAGGSAWIAMRKRILAKRASRR
jgi:peptidoglycan/xylan/chitin deacetylase (PgdA/CDA1 family)